MSGQQPYYMPTGQGPPGWQTVQPASSSGFGGEFGGIPGNPYPQYPSQYPMQQPAGQFSSQQGVASQVPPYQQQQPQQQMPSPFTNILSGAAGSGFIGSGLGAYSQRLFGTGRDYVRSNVDKYLSNTDFPYYFHVSEQYVRNKLKIILLPFLHKGHWTRVAEQVSGGCLAYKPPIHDINAPDLYIPFMAVATYVILGGLVLGLRKSFSPSSPSSLISRALLAWTAQSLLLRWILFSLQGGGGGGGGAGNNSTPLCDLVAYGGYAFVGVSLSLLASILWPPLYYAVMVWTTLSLGVFLVRTMKRVLFAETRHYDRDSTKHRYLLLFMAAAQFPFALWLAWL